MSDVRPGSGDLAPPTADDELDSPEGVSLPERVRALVVRQAADVLGSLAAEEVPAALRAAARFAPAKRARLAAGALAATLEHDAAFRTKVAQAAERAAEPLSRALRGGDVPPAADPVQVGALAFLTRPPGWTAIVARVRAELHEATEQAQGDAADRERRALQDRLAAARRDARTQVEAVRSELAAARSDLEANRRQLREVSARLRAAEGEASSAQADVVRLRRDVTRAQSTAQADSRRLQQRLTDAEQAVEAARRPAREARSTDDARLWLLLETLSGAAHGLRRELALGPPAQRPGDVLAESAQRPVPGPNLRPDDPALLDRLLSLPLAHLVVDGYNVTKGGYGELSLERQRTRLAGGLGALAAQTGAEVTCIFDGADRPPIMPPAPRGVRILFSAKGQTADEVIRQFVAAEPPGRAVVVVSSDREVADGVRDRGAYPVPSEALLRRLERG